MSWQAGMRNVLKAGTWLVICKSGDIICYRPACQRHNYTMQKGVTEPSFHNFENLKICFLQNGLSQKQNISNLHTALFFFLIPSIFEKWVFVMCTFCAYYFYETHFFVFGKM